MLSTTNHCKYSEIAIWCLDIDSTVMSDPTHSIVGLLTLSLGKANKPFSRLTKHYNTV